jgi:CDP-diacylglycerol---glycerol-3-phosphate 3-phosphatidyltransferase
MNIANWLTMLRIFLSFICIGFILQDTFVSLLAGFCVFVAASFTDFLDGFLARKHHLVSDLGKILDPIADKILIIGVFIAFLQLGIINAWMVSVIILREYIITHVRLYNFNKGVVLEAKRLGKHKTFSQVLGIVFIFITLLLHKEMPGNRVVDFLYTTLISWVMWYVMVITLVSGVHYFWINRRSIKTF